jgi:hypothetical protein
VDGATKNTVFFLSKDKDPCLKFDEKQHCRDITREIHKKITKNACRPQLASS